MDDQGAHGGDSLDSPDTLAVVFQEAAIAIVGTMAGIALGPTGAVAAALVGPFAVHAVKRLNEMSMQLAHAGVDAQLIDAKLASDEEIAHLVAEAVRGTVESDLASQRRLLARAVVRAVRDDAEVDVNQRIVRVASALDTVDVRVLARLPDPDENDARRNGLSREQLGEAWPGGRLLIDAAASSLIAAGLAEDAGIGTMDGLTMWRRTRFGKRFYEMLREEGLEDELDARERGRAPHAMGS